MLLAFAATVVAVVVPDAGLQGQSSSRRSPLKGVRQSKKVERSLDTPGMGCWASTSEGSPTFKSVTARAVMPLAPGT